MTNSLGVKDKPSLILTINGGSSTIKFGLYQADTSLNIIMNGKIDRIGLKGTTLRWNDFLLNQQGTHEISTFDHRSAANVLIDWLGERREFPFIKAIGHRVVHGMTNTEPTIVAQELLDELYKIVPYDPCHLTREIELMECFCKRYPQLPQVACFDTAFHQTMPRVARLLPLPRRFDVQGVQRYGFHGLSYTYLIQELTLLGDPAASHGRVILAHLGNGASLAAVRGGKSIDTTMGFTPAAGLMMGTRSGDLDPGLVAYLTETEQITTKQFSHMVYNESGLLGVSETSPDMQRLLEAEAGDIRAAEAVALFVYQIRKWIGAFTVALGGLDTLVFSGGIGENAPVIRARICEGLEFMGVELDQEGNAANNGIISTEDSRVSLRVIPTDEEKIIARMVCDVLDLSCKS